MSDIKTWHQRAMAHPDHQSGMISEDMIRARMCEEIEDLRAEIERLRVKNERLRERLLQERAALVLDEIGAALERERVLRAALTDMLSGWRYIRDTYGDLAGVGWDRVEQKARKALEGKP